jgi:hypothetical protein
MQVKGSPLGIRLGKISAWSVATTSINYKDISSLLTAVEFFVTNFVELVKVKRKFGTKELKAQRSQFMKNLATKAGRLDKRIFLIKKQRLFNLKNCRIFENNGEINIYITTSTLFLNSAKENLAKPSFDLTTLFMQSPLKKPLQTNFIINQVYYSKQRWLLFVTSLERYIANKLNLKFKINVV